MENKQNNVVKEEFEEQFFTFTSQDDEIVKPDEKSVYSERIEVKEDINPFDILKEDEYKENVEVVKENDNDELSYQAEESIQQVVQVEKEIDAPHIASVRKLPKLFYIGQLFGTYLITQNEDNLYIIDQHAANERINYEKILKDLKKDLAISYETLIPVQLSFTPSEAIIIEEKMDAISKLGIKLEDFGGGTYTVREIPVWIKPKQEKEFVEEIINHIINDRKSEKHQFLDSLAKSLACKKSVRGNEYLSQMQVEYILEDLEKCSNPYTCPHGRPIIVSYSKYEIEKWFKRVM